MRSGPFKGLITIGKDSTFRKRMRADRRSIDWSFPDVQVKNPDKYLHSHARKWQALIRGLKRGLERLRASGVSTISW